MNDTSLLGAAKIEPLLAVAHECVVADGVVAEFGVYRGGVLRELAAMFPDRSVFGCDTFDGLPHSDWSALEHHQPGEFRASFDEVAARFADLPQVQIIRGHLPESAPDQRYAFVHLDLDYYIATLNSLRWLAPRMAAGSAIVLDDVDWPYCPGVTRAIEEFDAPWAHISPHQGVIKF